MSAAPATALDTRIAAYVAFKRTLGWRYAEGERCLWRFAAYCVKEGLDGPGRAACEGFVDRVDAAFPEARRHAMSYLRGFARWARVHGDPDAHVLPGGWSARCVRPDVYLLAADEVAAFLGGAQHFDYAPPWPWQAKALFGLMHSCGLRPCEARRLGRGDVDCCARTVLVRDSKGPRSRLLPVSGEIAKMLADCDEANSRRWPARETFFAVRAGRRVRAGTLCDVFRLVWASAGLPRPLAPPYPVPYSLRHHFACANLEGWARSGQDPAVMLPYLSRYMGHASVESTLYYLHVSPGLVADYESLAGETARLLPEVGFDA